MTEDDQYAPHLFDPRDPPANTLAYPTQSKEKPDDAKLAGEYRGYYGRSEFTPYSSHFGKVRNSGTKEHGGVDIYAPYIPFPHETAVYAICKGRVEFVFDYESPDDIGNRAWLYPDHAKKDRVILGHLNRFVGANRKVEKGDLIGFAGCSGNADGLGECTTAGVFNINSGHVHLAFRPATGSPVDPLDKLGWTLRFADVKDSISLKKWVDEGNLLDKPAPPDFTFGTLRTQNAKRTERIKKSASPSKAPAPFQTIDFDDRNAIKKTAEFYELAYARLRDPQPAHAKAHFHDFGVNELDKTVESAKHSKDRMNAIIAELVDISKAAPDSAPLFERVRKSQTRSAEFLFEGIRLLWLAMAGNAMLPVAKNPGTIYDEKTKSRVPVPGSKTPWTGVVPRSGIGLWGKSILVSLGNVQAALQASFLKKIEVDANDPKKKKVVPYSKWTLSTSFGAGAPWQAVFDEKFLEELSDLPAASSAALKPYSASMYTSTQVYVYVAKIVCDNTKITDEQGLKRFLSSVTTMMSVLSGEGEQPGEAMKLLEALQAIADDKDIALDFLRTLAKTSAKAAAQAATCLDPKVNEIERIRSAYDLIWVEASG
ncbi:M23 family metallopeptidase [Rhizobium leguminosarum]|uniref:M23 family metallopeptidase n=1 Tax=Rhizobium leguminosarum TaxID=384 RepID=UPI002F9458EB